MSATLLATACPAILRPAALLSLHDAYTDPGSHPPPTAKPIFNGMSATLAPALAENASRLDLAGRYGGGGYAIASGLTLTAPGSGLSLGVDAGHALIDGPVEVSVATTVPVPNSSPRVWIWLTQGASVVAVNNSLTPPAAAACLLGSCVTSGGNITSVDTAGVVYLRGGTLWRETGDIGVPVDTPPNDLVFVARTVTGLYLWDGREYRAIDGAGGLVQKTITDADYTLAGLEREARILEIAGTLTAARTIVVPLAVGQFTVYNNTTGGYALTFQGATGTGTTVAATKRAILYCDGTNVVRVTADT